MAGFLATVCVTVAGSVVARYAGKLFVTIFADFAERYLSIKWVQQS
jgi:cysteine synthase